MKLQEGTEFNLITGADISYRKVIFQDNRYKIISNEGRVIAFSSYNSLQELNDYYCKDKSWKIEIISQPQPQFQMVDNSKLKEVSFDEAMKHYKMGVTIECRILNDQGVIIDWEKYHLCEGLEICLEFGEILYGKWYVEA